MQKYAEFINQIILDTFSTDVVAEINRPEPQFGDISTNIALKLAGDLKQNPRQVADQIAEKLKNYPDFKEVNVAGPGFINIRLTDVSLFELLSEPDSPKSSHAVVIETNNPNPFKAMHIGHAFNSIIADAIANLLETTTDNLHRVSYHGDVGLHVGKCMYALLNYVGNDPHKLSQVPDSEHNSFMSRMYADGARAYKEDADAKQRVVELAKMSFDRTDGIYAEVYDIVLEWSFSEIDKAVRRLGNKPIERRFLESEADACGVEIVRANTPDVFQNSDGALIFRGSAYGGFDNVFVGSNGLGLYSARDIGLMHLKNDQFHPVKSYIITAEEQKDYFKGVLAAAGLIWPDRKCQTINISTGTLRLTTGKMSSRDGEVIEIAWLFDQIASAIKERGGEPTDEIVAGALRYAFLKVRVGGDVVFDVNEAVSVQGNSGPYLQYAHARACSILAKVPNATSEVTMGSVELDSGERLLVRKLSEYSEVIEKSVNELMPHHICSYLYELAQEFNRFYEKSRIIGDEREAIRAQIVRLYRDTLARGLSVLGIVAPDKM